MPSSVDIQHPRYKAMSDQWVKCRAAAAGQKAVHAAGELFLPKLKDQTAEDYKAYKLRTSFFNASFRTISALSGLIFRKPPVVDVPKSIKPMLEDVTGTGVSFHILSQQVTIEDLTTGRLGILVDYPSQSTEGMTQADAEAHNIQPTMQLYKAEPFYNWKTGRVNNKTVPVEVQLMEDYSYPSEGFENPKTETRYRILDLVRRSRGEGVDENEGLVYRVRVFRIDDSSKEQQQVGSDLFPLMNGKPLSYIPFYSIGVDDTDIDSVLEPPLIDLVDLNLAHYRMNADYRHGLHFAGLPTATFWGYRPEDGDKIHIGGAAALCFPEPSGHSEYLEFTGQGLGSIKTALDDLKEEMAILASRILSTEKKATETSQTAQIHRAGESSILSAIAQTISIGLTKALNTFCEWAGQSGKWSVELNRDFMPTGLDAQQLTALVGAWQQGAFSQQVLFENLQKADIIASPLTLEEMQEQINTAPIPKPGDDA